MRIFIGALSLIGFLFIVVPVPDTFSQSGIIVNNASTTRMINPGIPPINLNVHTRIAVQYGNSLRYLPIDTIPSSLQALSDGIAPHMSVQHANNIRHINLAIMPNTFQTLLSHGETSIAFQYVNSNRQFLLSYPSALFRDTVAPIISNTANNSSRTKANIAWITDEFTLYILRYGMQQGNRSY